VDTGCAEGIVQSDDEESEDAIFSSVREVTPEEASAGVFSITDVVLPLPGSRVIYSKNLKVLYDNMCKADGVQLVGFAHAVQVYSFGFLTGAYRRLLIKTDDVKFSFARYSDPQMDLTETDLVGLSSTRIPHITSYLSAVHAMQLEAGSHFVRAITECGTTLVHVSDCVGSEHARCQSCCRPTQRWKVSGTPANFRSADVIVRNNGPSRAHEEHHQLQSPHSYESCQREYHYLLDLSLCVYLDSLTTPPFWNLCVCRHLF